MLTIPPTSDRPLTGCPVAVLDWETTGTDPATCEPVQVAVVHLTLGANAAPPRVVLSQLIRPPCPILPEVTEDVHGITDEMVADAPTIAEVLPELLAALDGRLLAAYNLPYDWRILSRWLPDEPFGTLDPLVWAKVIQRYERGKTLTDVCKRYRIPINAHDAAGDTMATAQLMPEMLQDMWLHPECGPAPLRSVSSLWRWTVDAGAAWEAWFSGYLASKGETMDSTPWTDAREAMR